MDSSDISITACRLCQHYNPQGRRGGFCEKLDVPVSSSWDACSLAAHPFKPSWYPNSDFNSLFDALETIAIDPHLDLTDRQEIVMRSLSFSEC